ncbi:hypothetical protein QO004_000467 [Rhizobium mesoamericanum]|uniref:hypothetical protein n=1 Tax=Rhizobium mesoamericanum TaxID=1079800 RepID=UPI00278AD7EA|nr:hypothetical protein [Rhizobium mesoamericanum]MDQ0558692.1 hypothetical protein [Rhizobium mesoamericanum]
MRQRYCRVCGGWHELDAWPHNCMPEQVMTRSSLPSPHFVSDTIEIRSMHDGQFYTSKSKLRSEYRAHGVEEIGNEQPRPIEKPKADRKAIHEALKQAYQQHTA